MVKDSCQRRTHRTSAFRADSSSLSTSSLVLLGLIVRASPDSYSSSSSSMSGASRETMIVPLDFLRGIFGRRRRFSDISGVPVSLDELDDIGLALCSSASPVGKGRSSEWLPIGSGAEGTGCEPSPCADFIMEGVDNCWSSFGERYGAGSASSALALNKYEKPPFSSGHSVMVQLLRCGNKKV
jgi:hypothetical protein